MIPVTPTFTRRISSVMRFRDIYYLIISIAFLIYQFSGAGGKLEIKQYFIFFAILLGGAVADKIILSYIKIGLGSYKFSIISVGKDILILTYLIHLTGGIESPFILLYLVLIIAGGATLGFYNGILVLAVSMAFLLTLLFCEYKNIVLHYPQNYLRLTLKPHKNKALFIIISAELLYVALFGILSNRYIVKRLRIREKELANTVKDLNQTNKQLEFSNSELIDITNQLELQKEMLNRSNQYQRVLYEITTHMVEQHSVDVLLRKIHNELSNIMPIISCAIIIKRREDNELQIISSISGSVTTTENIWEIFNNTLDTKEGMIYNDTISSMVKSDKNNSVVMLYKKDPAGRAFRDNEITILYAIAKQISIYLDRMELYNILQHLSNTDGLTGIYNHRFFHIRLEEEFSRCRRNNTPISLIIMDMDDFKTINDQYGHQEGDKVLKSIVGILKDCIRNTDILARYGGDEFVVILPDTDYNTAMNVAMRIIEKLKTTDIPVREEFVRLSACMGLSSMEILAILSTKELINKADNALYHAKKKGVGIICSS